MTSPAVDVLLFRLGPHRLAVELHLVSSVLAPDEARGIGELDPRPHLLPAGVDPECLDEPGPEDLVGLLDISGPPVVLLLGEVLGSATIRRSDLIAVPPWVAGFLPAVINPACVVIDQKVVWLLNLDTLNQTSLF